MAKTLTLSAVTCGLEGYFNNATDNGEVRQNFDSTLKIVQALTSGTTDSKADLIFIDQRTIADGANDDLDLAGGVTDAFGAAITFVTVKGIYISSPSTNVAGLQIGGAAGAALTTLFGNTSDFIILKKNGVFMTNSADTGYAVTATTADILRLTHDGTDTSNLVVDVAIWGTSA